MSEEGGKKLGRPRKYPLNSRVSECFPRQRLYEREISTSVEPEERDYYYNLDFLCGTYHNPKNRGARKDIKPEHALGYGEGNEDQ